jgi:stage III sporulation protein AC
MEIDVLLRIAGIGVLIAVVNSVLSRAGRDEMATMVTLAGLVIVLLMVVGMVSDLFTAVKQLFII